MTQHDGTIRMYAESGLRTIEDWVALGRDVTNGAKPRLDTPHRGGVLSLYSRGQTHPRPRAKPDLH